MPVEPASNRINVKIHERPDTSSFRSIAPFTVTSKGDYRIDLISSKVILKGDPGDIREINSLKEQIINTLKRSQEDLNLEEITKIKEWIINKFFPPYPPGGEERVEEIKGIPAFRILIERLSLSFEELERAFQRGPEDAERISEELRGYLNSSSAGITSRWSDLLTEM